MYNFLDFITEQTDFQKKDFSVEYAGRNNVVTNLTYKGKHVDMIVMTVPHSSGKMVERLFIYDKSSKRYLSTAGRSNDMILFKNSWNAAKGLRHVRF